ncbi:MAG: PLDc N-terminal domain-containing protein [Desulfobacteraceae bacterium]
MDSAFVIVTVSGLIFWALTMLALIDVILKDFGTLRKKAVWFLTAAVPFAGWLVYLVFGFRKGTRKQFGVKDMN